MQRADFFVKFEVPQRQQLASERTSLTLFAPAPSTYPVRGGQASQKQLPPAFLCSGMGGRGLLRAPGVPENASRTTEGCSAHTNICSVPEEGVSGTKYHSCTRKACFLHQVPQKMRRVPQEPVLRTARIFRTTGGPLRYRMPQTQRSHILRRRLPRHQHPHYIHPPHYSHALITDIRLMEAARDKKQPLC